MQYTQVIHLEAGKGKTTIIMDWLEEDENNLLIVNSRKVSWLKQIRPHLSNRIISYHAYLIDTRKYKSFKIGIDDLDEIFDNQLDIVTILKK